MATVGKPGTNTKLAKQLVKDSVAGAKTDVKNQKKQVKTETKQAGQDARDLYTRAVGDLNHIYTAGDQQIAASGQRTQDSYNTAAASMKGRGSQISGNFAGNTAAADAALKNSGAKFGFGAGLGSGATRDANMAQAVAHQSSVNAQNTLAMMQTAAQQATQMLLGSMKGSHTSQLGKQLQTRNDSITDIGRNRDKEIGKLNDELSKIRATEPGLLRQMVMDLDRQGFDQWQAIQQLNLSRQQFEHSKKQDAASLALQRQRQQHDMSMDMSQLLQDSAYYGTTAETQGGMSQAEIKVWEDAVANYSPVQQVGARAKGLLPNPKGTAPNQTRN